MQYFVLFINRVKPNPVLIHCTQKELDYNIIIDIVSEERYNSSFPVLTAHITMHNFPQELCIYRIKEHDFSITC